MVVHWNHSKNFKNNHLGNSDLIGLGGGIQGRWFLCVARFENHYLKSLHLYQSKPYLLLVCGDDYNDDSVDSEQG